MSEVSMKDSLGLELLRGQSTEGVQLQSNVIRVFISSTFSDMSRERDALLEKAYPELQSFCQSLGLVFEVVDMRWGVRDTIAVDHMTTELCLQEIQSCKRMSVGPTFTVLLGNRYGYRPIPRLIPGNEFELLLSKLAKDKEGVGLLTHWFWKDENSIPSTYVLQPITTHLPHYDDTRPESGTQHDNDVVTWRITEERILRLLRTAAVQAETDGAITAVQKHKFFKSVTEWEIEQGIQKSDPCAVLFMRELPRLLKNDSQRSFPQFMDVTADGLADKEAQELLSKLKSQIYDRCSGFVNLHCLELTEVGIDPSCKEHAQYLQSLCEQFVAQMKDKISRALGPSAPASKTGGAEWGWLWQEIIHHLLLSSTKCVVFCGRQNLLGKICLTMWETTNAYHGPLVVYGPSGIGKTALMCKLAQDMRGVLGPKSVVVQRLLGTSPLSSEIDSVLRSICFQVCGAVGLSLPTSQTTNTHEDLVRFFHSLLAMVSEQGDSLLIVLDSLDQLSNTNHAHKLHWLPKDIPPNVQIVVSTLDSGPPLLEALRGMIPAVENFFQVEQLGVDQGREIIDAYMGTAGRRLTPDQRDVVLRGFQQCGHPLLLRLTLDAARQWASYTPVSELQIGSTTQEAVALLFQHLEKKHGRQLISSALGYIVTSRDGLSEAELRDVLSLDDEVLADIYQYWLPPSTALIRLPPLLWSRIRHDLGEYLVERQTHGVTVLGLYHRQFIEMVQERYLSAESKAKSHSVLSDYFLSLWSQGRLKPIFLHSLKTELNADRKVSAQPLWFAEGLANTRKLRELPYHLVHAGKWEELKQEIIGSTEWLCCKTVTCGVASVIEDLSLCAETSGCPEMGLIRDTFVLLKPTLDFIDGPMDPCLFYTEIFVRLHTFTEMYPSLIGRLCSQCQDWFNSCPNPVLVPSCSFFQSPGGALKTTLTGFQKGITAVDLCAEKGILVAGSEDGNVIAWNLDELEVVHNFIGHTEGVLCVKVIDMGGRCLSSASDGTLRLWSLQSGRQLYSISTGCPNSAQLPSQIHVIEERAVIYGITGSQLKAWHLEKSELLFQIALCEGNVSSMLGVLKGAVASLTDQGLLAFYDWSTGSEKKEACLTMDQQNLTPTCILTLRRHDKLVIGSKEGFLHLVSSHERQTITQLLAQVSFLIASDDENLLCAGSENQIAVFHVQENLVQRVLPKAFQHEDTVLTAAAPCHRKVLITGCEDQTIRVWCLSTGDLLDTFVGMGAPVTALVVYEDTVISMSSSTYYLKLWQLEYNHKHKTKSCFPASSPLITLSHSADTMYFLKHGDRKEVIIQDCCTGTSNETITVSAEVSCMELAPQKKLLFCGVKTGTVLIYPLEFAPEALCIPPPQTLPSVRCLAVNRREDRVAVAYEDGVSLFEITIRDSFPCVEGPIKKLPLSLLESTVSSMALLSGSRLLNGRSCGEVMMYDFKSASAVSMDGHGSEITCVTVSNQGTHAFIGSQDYIQRLWRLSPLELNCTMEYKGFFYGGILCAAFSKNDKYIYTGSRDRTIKVWDVCSGHLLVVQYVYASVTQIVTLKDGLVAVSQLGHLIKERFCCPNRISVNYNPLQNIRGKYRVISKISTSKKLVLTQNTEEGRPVHLTVHKTKSSHACLLL
ncbi:hypothetical protein SKAU_G00053700 [Synaphobranchus kaupii]|uniref:NACHT and WD repeat domain containing 1 n=1 Tax=Synaphobranchus kaupii TaxID=118154 RepID=A0A9Q1JA09_SYNKA|nr:hypothetical protein SKAU_G00053700 [Synaphobranchus kaupii]